MDAVRILPPRGQSYAFHAPPAPTPEAFMDALQHVDDDFLGQEWHVVYKGKRPGVYPAW